MLNVLGVGCEKLYATSSINALPETIEGMLTGRLSPPMLLSVTDQPVLVTPSEAMSDPSVAEAAVGPKLSPFQKCASEVTNAPCPVYVFAPLPAPLKSTLTTVV